MWCRFFQKMLRNLGGSNRNMRINHECLSGYKLHSLTHHFNGLVAPPLVVVMSAPRAMQITAYGKLKYEFKPSDIDGLLLPV